VWVGWAAHTIQRVRFSGFEVWQIGADGLIAEPRGPFDSAAYRRQVERGIKWICPKCGKVIVANSPNTLKIDVVEHLKWHEIKDLLRVPNGF